MTLFGGWFNPAGRGGDASLGRITGIAPAVELRAAVSSRSFWVRLLLVAYVAVFTAYRLWSTNAQAAALSPFDLGQLVLPWAAVALCLLASRLAAEPRERWAWRLLAAAYVAGAWGEALWVFQRMAGSDTGATPVVASVAWLAYYPLVLAALVLLMPRDHGGCAALTATLDGFLFTLGPAGLCWWLVVQPAVENAGDPLAALVNAVWPLGDLVITFALISLVSRWDLARVPWSLIYFLSAFSIQVLADALCVLFQAQRRFDPTVPLDPLYAATYVLAALAALSRLHALGDEPTLNLSRARTARLFLPYLALPAAGLLMLLEFSQGIDAHTPQVLLLVAAVVALVLVRQLLTVLENNRLSESLAALSEELERRVRERTEELDQRTRDLVALNQVATQLSHCLSLDDVLETGIRLACEALRAPAGAIWLGRADGRMELLGHYGFDEATCRMLAEPNRQAPTLAEALVGGTIVRLRAETVFAGAAAATWDFSSRPCLTVVPLLSRRAVVGALAVAGRPDGSFGDEASHLCQGVGAELGVALDNARRFESVKDLADRDPLTGLLNRRALQDHLGRELKRAERGGTPLSLLLIDVDGFKAVNDTHGHSVGDAVLRRVARLLTGTCRSSETVGRFGGDEFVILAPNAPTAGAVALAQRVRRLAAQKWDDWSGPEVTIGLSFGIATFPWDAQEGQALLERADANLYRSKQAGGNAITASPVGPSAKEQPPLSSLRPRRQARAEAPSSRVLMSIAGVQASREMA